MRSESGFRMAAYWPYIAKKHNVVRICRHGEIVNFFDIAMFLLSSLVTGASFMSIS